eukprot:2465198-Pyramimonas_sp.AAC.1
MLRDGRELNSAGAVRVKPAEGATLTAAHVGSSIPATRMLESDSDDRRPFAERSDGESAASP